MSNPPPLSVLASFDDIRRCIRVLTDGTAEEEFLRVLRLQEKYREESQANAMELLRIQKELDASLMSLSDLETKLYHARRLLEMENRARREAEYERDQLEKKIVAVADFVQKEVKIQDDVTKEKFAFLNTLPRKRKSANHHLEEKYGNEINSTRSFFSDLSITQSDDDFLDVNNSGHWQKHRPSVPKNSIPVVGSKRSRLSGGGGDLPNGQSPSNVTARRSQTRRSGVGVQKHTLDVAAGSEMISATTKVTIPQDGNGAIRAESTIESRPLQYEDDDIVEVLESAGDGPKGCTTPFKQATAPPMTPSSAVPLYTSSPSQKQINRPTIMRQHNFVSKTFICTDTCKQCQKKIRFGSVGLRCRDCPVRCHVDCRYLLTIACVPQSGTPTLKGMMGYVTDYAPAVAPMIPALIVHCVNEIETRGLTEVGIYRVSGSEREVKALKERFLRSKGTPHLANIDVHVLCGCIKDFLRSLREPLIPTNTWTDFCNAIQNTRTEDIQRDLYRAIEALPQANRDTLAFMVLHFQRVAECREVLMPIENIARVFGPTIVGYSTPDPDQHAIFTEVHIQCSVMLNLLKIPTDYWTQYVTMESDKENNHTGSTIKATPNKNNKESLYSLYATPLKSTMKKRKFLATPPYSHRK